MNEITFPTFDELMNPLLEALRLLGGSGSIEIRFLFIGSQLRSTLPSHARSPLRS